jgi:hypothetical protein
MSQKLEQFNNGFFTMSGAVVSLVLVYPLFHTCKVLCKKIFRNSKCKCNSKCDC